MRGLRQRASEMSLQSSRIRASQAGQFFGKQRALYVTDKTARSVYRLLPRVVGLRLPAKIGPTMDLENAKPDDEREEQQADGHCSNWKAALRRY